MECLPRVEAASVSSTPSFEEGEACSSLDSNLNTTNWLSWCEIGVLYQEKQQIDGFNTLRERSDSSAYMS